MESVFARHFINIFCVLFFCGAKFMFLRVFMAGSRNLLTPSVACKVKSLFDDAVRRFVMFFLYLSIS